MWDFRSGHLVCSPGRTTFKICAVAFNSDGRWANWWRGPCPRHPNGAGVEIHHGQAGRSPSGAYGMANSIEVSPDGARALAMAI